MNFSRIKQCEIIVSYLIIYRLAFFSDKNKWRRIFFLFFNLFRNKKKFFVNSANSKNNVRVFGFNKKNFFPLFIRQVVYSFNDDGINDVAYNFFFSLDHFSFSYFFPPKNSYVRIFSLKKHFLKHVFSINKFSF